MKSDESTGPQHQLELVLLRFYSKSGASWARLYIALENAEG
jgi:hypothetical protein